MNTNHFKYSIVTVTYNCADTIERTIQSVLGQTYNNIEYIVVDGDSTDGTKAILDRYSKQIAHYISEPDNGLYYAMNKGIAMATGDFIGFLNGDDYYTNSRVIAAVNQYVQENVDILAGRISVNGVMSPGHSKIQLNTMRKQMAIPHPAMFTRKSLFDKIGRFDVHYRIAADYDWTLRAYEYGAEFLLIDDCLVNFDPGGLSSSIKSCVETAEIVIKNGHCNVEEMKRKYITNVLLLTLRNSLRQCAAFDQKFLLYRFHTWIIWGTGTWGKRLANYVGNTHLFQISCFMESRGKVENFAGHSVYAYQKERVTAPILIATSLYVDDISARLSQDGFCRGKDYFTLTDVAETMNLDGTEAADAIREIRNL